MPKLHVSFGSNSFIDVEANNTSDLAEIVDRSIKKFFPDTTYSAHDF